jgi:hypothetical protein
MMTREGPQRRGGDDHERGTTTTGGRQRQGDDNDERGTTTRGERRREGDDDETGDDYLARHRRGQLLAGCIPTPAPTMTTTRRVVVVISSCTRKRPQSRVFLDAGAVGGRQDGRQRVNPYLSNLWLDAQRGSVSTLGNYSDRDTPPPTRSKCKSMGCT